MITNMHSVSEFISKVSIIVIIQSFPDASRNIWRQISQKSDGSLTPEYEKIEELFAQQTKKAAATEQKPKKAPKDVSLD